MSAIFIMLGLFYSISQVLILRELLVVFLGNEIIFGIFFASWFFWIGIGSFFMSRISHTIREPMRLFVVLQLFLPVVLVCQMICIWHIRVIMQMSPAEIIPLGSTIGISFLITLPLGALIGIIFPLGCITADVLNSRTYRHIGNLYMYETGGSIIGGLLFSWWMAGRISHVAIMLGLTLLLSISLLVVITKIHQRGLMTTSLSMAAISAGMFLVISALILATPVQKKISFFSDIIRWRNIQSDLVFLESRHTRYQYAAIGRYRDQYSLLGDGKFIDSFPEYADPLRFASAVFAQKPDAKDILLVEGGSAGLIRELLAYPYEKIDIAVQDPALFALMRKYIPAADEQALKDRRVSVHFTDGRRFVQDASRGSYDAIIVNLPDPASAFLNRYYTKDFYSLAAEALNDDGFICISVISGENYIGKYAAAYNASVYHTLKSIFPYTAIQPGNRQIFFAAPHDTVVTDDYRELEERFRSIVLKENVFSADMFRTLYSPERVAFARNELEKTGRVINTDLKPITYYFNLLVWSNFTGSEWVRILEHVRRGGIWLFAAICMLVVLLFMVYVLLQRDAAFGRKLTAFLIVFIAGAIAMGLQIILIFLYQSLFGYIYEQIGMVTALFMSGLMAGVWLMQKYAADQKETDTWIMRILFATTCFLGVLPFMCDLLMHEALFFLFFIVSGFLTGGIFPLGVTLYGAGSHSIGETAGIIDSADHTGAMLGALVSGSLMVPLLGIRESCWVLGMLAVAGIVCVLFSKKHFSLSWQRMSLVGAVIIFLLMVTLLVRRYPDRGEAVISEWGSITLNTKDMGIHLQGYRGPVYLAITITGDGKIRGVRIAESKEDSEFLNGMEEWLANFEKLRIAEDFPIDRADVDVLTGATKTSTAIIRIINEAVLQLNRGITKKIADSKIPEHEKPSGQLLIVPRNARALDGEQLKKAFASGSLSNKEALYYKKLEE